MTVDRRLILRAEWHPVGRGAPSTVTSRAQDGLLGAGYDQVLRNDAMLRSAPLV
jgi:hypothetical protein